MSSETELLIEIKHILRLAFRKEIAEALREVREDTVMAAIIQSVGDESRGTPVVQKEVALRCDVSERTVRDRIASLAELGILEVDRAGRTYSCKVTALAK